MAVLAVCAASALDCPCARAESTVLKNDNIVTVYGDSLTEHKVHSVSLRTACSWERGGNLAVELEQMEARFRGACEGLMQNCQAKGKPIARTIMIESLPASRQSALHESAAGSKLGI